MKLAAVLFLPVMLLAILGATQVLAVREHAQEASAEASLASVVTGPGSLLDTLIAERNYSAVYLLGAAQFFDSVEDGAYLDSREEVDRAREQFEDFIADQSEEVQQLYAPAVEALSGMSEVRAYIDADEGPRGFQNAAAMEDMFDRFQDVLTPLFDANEQVTLLVKDPALRNATTIVDHSLRQSNNLAVLTYQLAIAAIGGEDPDGINTSEEYIAIAQLWRDMQVSDQIIRLNAEGALAEVVDAVYATPHIQEFGALVEESLETGIPPLQGIFRAAQGDGESLNYSSLRTAAEEEIEETADSLDRDARMTQLSFLGLGTIVLIVMVIVTVLVALSITRPLRSLTRLAMDMANDQLPGAVRGILEAPPGEDVAVPAVPPIEIQTRDEVADVARALSTVQDSALKLAAEQAALRRNIADSFVNLGRRNQALLGRQLDFITELEQNETDPEALSNLFRLDHLATRMRRNAESLLVLAGIEPPRRWTSPVRLTDVIRASLGEVEDYQRVSIQSVESATIVGSAAADLAHLLAELIENALTFSPPDQAVEVRGRYTPVPPSILGQAEPPADRGVYTLTITDLGVGMSDENIARANLRLAGKESFTIAPSKFLGHYVAGMIAGRHGIEVALHSSPKRGLTATVALPPKLLSSQEAVGIGAPALAPTPSTRAVAGGAARAARRPPAPGSPPVYPTTISRALNPYVPPAPEVAAKQGSAGPGDGSKPPPPIVPTLAPEPAGVTGSSGALPAEASPVAAGGVEKYRVGNTEFQIDRGTSVGPVAEDGASYAQLIQRVQGAQMPTTRPVSVPRASLPAGAPKRPGQEDDERRARHVHSFLSSFSAGLEQGRDAAARQEPGSG